MTRSGWVVVVATALVMGGLAVGSAISIRSDRGAGGVNLAAGPPKPEQVPELEQLRKYEQVKFDGAFTPRGGADGLTLTHVAGGFEIPTHVSFPPGDREAMVVTERGGAIWMVRDGRRLREPFLDLRRRVRTIGYEQGLHSIVFAPDYERSRRFYVMYTDDRDKPVVEEYRRSRSSPDRAVPRSRRRLLEIDHPPGGPPGGGGEDMRFHNGGQLQFGPDRMLYVGTGDGGPHGDPRGRGQSRSTLLGKILRIDPRPSGGRPYSIPEDNPFADVDGARPEIWAYGLRNPWRFSFDSESGDLYIGDVGGYLVEEVNIMAPDEGGRNFGWSCWEGRVQFKPCAREEGEFIPPVLQRPSSGVVGHPVALIGGFVIRDPRLPDYDGAYIYAEFTSHELSMMRLAGDRVTDRALGLKVISPTSFGQDAENRIYISSYYNGAIHRLDPR